MGLLVQSVEHRPLPPRVGSSMLVRRMFLDLVRFERPHTVRYRARLLDRTRATSLESGQGGGGWPEPFSSATMPVSHAQFVGLGLQEITKAEEGLAAFGFGRFQGGRSFFVRHDCFSVAGKTLS